MPACILKCFKIFSDGRLKLTDDSGFLLYEFALPVLSNLFFQNSPVTNKNKSHPKSWNHSLSLYRRGMHVHAKTPQQWNQKKNHDELIKKVKPKRATYIAPKPLKFTAQVLKAK